MTTRQEALESGKRLHDLLMSRTPENDKLAKQELSDYTRLFRKEASFLPNIIDASPFDESRIVPQFDTGQPVMYFEYETPSPGAVQVDLGNGPMDFIPYGKRYALRFQKTQTRQTVIDTINMHSYDQDIRAIIADAKAKDLAARDDAKLIRAARKLVGAVDEVKPWAGQAMHRDFGTSLNFRAFIKGSQVTEQTEYAIPTETVLMNHLREADFALMTHENNQGTQTSVDVMFQGFTQREFYKQKVLLTIKKKYVPIAESFWFARQNYLGRYVQMIEPTMELERKDTKIMFYLYKVDGLVLANAAAIALNRYLPS